VAKYKYKAFDADGKEKSGVVDGMTRTRAGVALLDRGLRITELEPHRSVLQFELTKKKVPRKDLMYFSRQMAVFLRAGIAVLDALEVILEETTNKIMNAALNDIVDGLRGGSTFAGAAREHPEMFPDFYLGVLEAAELTGNLDGVLDELATYIGRDLDARRKVQSALFYPTVVAFMSVGTVGVLAVYVLPKFKKFFESLHAKLPLPTRMLLSMTGFMQTSWPILLLGLIAVVCVLLFGPRTQVGRRIKDRLVLKIPIVGDLVRESILERFCRTLSSMVRAGVGLPEALEVAAEGSNNVVYKAGLTEVQSAMLEGEGLAGPIARSGLFPGAARQMLRVGEETGTLDRQLQTAADYFDKELGYKIERFTNLFEPAVIIFMGVVVGFVAIALVTAMYGIFNQVKV
jgi:type IV pilus assembly protein PilC